MPPLSGAKPLAAADLAGQAQERRLPTPTRATGLDTQTGEPRTAPAGRAHGRRPRGPNGAAQRARTDIRAHLCPAQLRIPARTRSQGRTAARTATAGRG